MKKLISVNDENMNQISDEHFGYNFGVNFVDSFCLNFGEYFGKHFGEHFGEHYGDPLFAEDFGEYYCENFSEYFGKSFDEPFAENCNYGENVGKNNISEKRKVLIAKHDLCLFGTKKLKWSV